MVGAVMGPLTEGDPRRVGPYTTAGRLGAGALGPLYAGRSDDGRTVTVRVLRADLLADEAVKARLAADLAAARTVAGPFAAPVLGADLDAETPWVASGYVAGVPLAKAVADHGPLPEPALLSLAAGLAEALAALQAAGVMHGDLRPGTVLLTPDGPRIVDYALVRAFDGAVEVGMAGFLAPEQAMGRTVTASADMFALGSTLFFATTGRAPFGEGAPAEVKKRVAKSSPVLGKLPASMSELIRGCFQKDANGRAQPQQVLEYVRRRTSNPMGNGWLPPEVAADVRAAAAEPVGGPGADANATIVSAPIVPAPGGPAGFGSAARGPAVPPPPQQADGGTAVTGAVAAAGGQIPSFGQGQPAAAAAYGAAPQMPGSQPAPSRRNLLLALTGGVVVVGGGTAFALGLGGSSGTTTTADAQPSGGSVGAVPSTSAAAAEPSASASGHRLPADGPLPPPVGAAGSLQGPDAVPFWQTSSAGAVASLAFGDDMLVVSTASGVSGYDLGFNQKWGPVKAAGVAGSGNGVVAAGAAYVIVASEGASGGDLLALDVKTGAQKWRVPMPQGFSGARVAGVLSGTVLAVGMSGPAPFLLALDAANGRPLWQKNGVEFATLALPADGTQIVAAGMQGPDSAGTCLALNVLSGDQVWARPMKTLADSGRVSLSKLAYVGDRYVCLLPAAPNRDSVVGGTVAGGVTTWNAMLPEPAGDAGTAAFITRSPDLSSVVALSEHGLYAVDARSGSILWDSQSTESFTTASDAGAPQLADGNVYAHDRAGTWWAVDLASGRTRWKYSFAGVQQGSEPVWLAVPGGVVVSVGGTLTMLQANGSV